MQKRTHRSVGRRKRNDMMNICIDGALLLAEALIKLCVKDYKRAMRTLRKNPDSYRAKDDIREIEAFFHSRLFAAMVDVDPDCVIKKLREGSDDSKGILKSGVSYRQKNQQ